MPPKRKIPSASPSPSPASRKSKLIKSCSACHRRKVKCSLETPACAACRRHARTLGLDPAAVVCEYTTEPGTLPPLPSPPAEAPLEELVGPGGRSLRKLKSRLIRPDYRECEDETTIREQEQIDDAPIEPEEGRIKNFKRVKLVDTLDEDRHFAGLGIARDVRRVDRPVVDIPRSSSFAKSNSPQLYHQKIHSPLPVSQLPTPATSPVTPAQPFFTSLFGQQSFSISQPPKLVTPYYEDDGLAWRHGGNYSPAPYSDAQSQWAFHPGLEIYTPPLYAPATSYMDQGYFDAGATYGSDPMSYLAAGWQESAPFFPHHA